MAFFTRDDVTIHYEEHGSGFPVLLIAPGGMGSALKFWQSTPWNPIDQLSSRYRVIAMDQRNAGESTAPVAPSDGWDAYTADQLALLEYLGVERFAVLGMCIGGSYIANLIKTAPDQVAAAVMLQPIGLDENRQAFQELFDAWADQLKPTHPDVSDEVWASYRANMYGSDKFLFTASVDEVATMTTPMLVMMGNDPYHPQSASRTVAATAPNAILIESWKEGEAREQAMEAVTTFLEKHTS